MEPQSGKPLRIGLIGCGWVSQHHLSAWASLADQATVVCLADPVAENAARRATEFNVPRYVTSIEALLATGNIDAIDIATPRETHADIVRAAAARGIAVLCQKPLAPTFESALNLVREVNDQTRLMVHENWRFRPYIREMRRWIEQGEIGELTQCQFNLFNSGFVADANGSMPAIIRQPFFEHLPRMLVMEILIHHIDALRYLFGPLSLSAAWTCKVSERIQGEDGAAIFMRTRAEAPAAVIIQATMTAVGLPARSPDKFRIFGTKGTIVFKGGLLQLWGQRNREIIFDLEESYRASYRGAIAHFVNCLRDGSPFETGPDDNLETLRLVEEIYEKSAVAVTSENVALTCDETRADEEVKT